MIAPPAPTLVAANRLSISAFHSAHPVKTHQVSTTHNLEGLHFA